MADKKTLPGVPTKMFTDAGTEETFEQGKVYDFEPGAHANYLAAGLIAEPENKAPVKTTGA